MRQLVMLTATLFAILDSDLGDKIAVGTLDDARAYMRDFWGTTDAECDLALSVMAQYNVNAANFGVCNGGFTHQEQVDTTPILAKVA